MTALWVWLELVPLAALLFLVGFALLAREKKPASSGLRTEIDEPQWWSEFEREFALYVKVKRGVPNQRRRES